MKALQHELSVPDCHISMSYSFCGLMTQHGNCQCQHGNRLRSILSMCRLSVYWGVCGKDLGPIQVTRGQ